MIVYTLEQRWEVDLRSTYRRCRFWQKKIIFSDEAHFDLGGYLKSKIVAFRIQKTSTHTLKSRRTQKELPIYIIGSVFYENEQGEAVTVNGDRYRAKLNKFSQKLKKRILATFGFNRTALRTTQPKRHSMFCALFLKIALSATELMSFAAN